MSNFGNDSGTKSPPSSDIPLRIASRDETFKLEFLVDKYLIFPPQFPL